MKTPKGKLVHATVEQIMSALIRAQVELHCAGRGSGKTDGVLTERAEHNAFKMVRSLQGMVGPSYYKVLTQFMPKFRKGMERMGYMEGAHYFIGDRAPRAWRWDLPYSAPAKRFDTFIHIKCGSGIQMFSQDRPGSSSGVDLDALLLDEFKLLDIKMLESETLPAMRGNDARFGHLSEYGSICAVTDRPRGKENRAIYDWGKKMDKRVIDTILSIQVEIYELQQAIYSGHLTASTTAEYERRIARYEATLNELRKGTTYYVEYSALANIHVLGLPYLKRELANLSPFEFDTSILNLPIDRVEGGFYPDLDMARHTYDNHDIGYIESVRNDWAKLEHRDCRHDATLQRHLPIDIAMDFGYSFNCLVVGQLFHDEYNVDNCFYVKHPQKIRHVLELFDAYYQYHPNREVNFIYDHTATGGDASREFTFAEEVTEILTKLGWTVRTVYIGLAPDHHDKYVFWGRVLNYQLGQPHPAGMPKVRINRDNCEALLLSMQLAPARQMKDRFEKDKRSEGRDGDQAEATHLSDACDTLIWGRLNSEFSSDDVPMGAVFGSR